MVRLPLHHALDAMSITPSKALLDILSPAKVRSPAVTQALSVMRAKTVEQSDAVPGAVKPGSVMQQGANRPMRRGAILDISV